MPQGSDEIVDSVVLITGTNSERFGTGFVFRSEGGEIWILTCAHVVRDVGGPGNVRIDDERVEAKSATVLACGQEHEADLAVLQATERKGRRIPALQLGLIGRKGLPCAIPGIAELDGRRRRIEPLEGRLGTQIVIQAPGGPRIRAWKLWIEGKTLLEEGYSGSPVACDGTNAVVAVASHMEYQGARGYGISVGNLPDVWPATPSGLLSIRPDTDSGLDGEIEAADAPMPEEHVVTPGPHDVRDIKCRALEAKLGELLKDYEDTMSQSSAVLGVADRNRLNRQAQDLWTEIEKVEQELKASCQGKKPA